mmetsp:Transcript_12524/g.29345  ORF Transcript_12524/g.29345 Transcript_12524/m.29345 type:complete len:80 (+) Transcript_12524:480-719(+)
MEHVTARTVYRFRMCDDDKKTASPKRTIPMPERKASPKAFRIYKMHVKIIVNAIITVPVRGPRLVLRNTSNRNPMTAVP